MGTKRQKMDFAGLRRRDTYEEIINYLENEQEIIKYPDRRAKFLRDSPYLTQLDNEGIRTLEEQETGAIRQRAKDDMLRELGFKADGSVSRAERAATFDIGTAPSTPTYGAASPRGATERSPSHGTSGCPRCESRRDGSLLDASFDPYGNPLFTASRR